MAEKAEDASGKQVIIYENDAELKKAVEAIAIRPTGGKITLPMRRAFNILLICAQEQGEEQEVYRVRLADVMKSSSYDSRDYETFKEYLRRMKRTEVEWHSTSEAIDKRWGISSLLAEVEIIDRGQGLEVEFSFGPKIKKRLLDPSIYARLSLSYLSQLRSNAAFVLYELCSRYVTNPSGLTMRHHWHWWRPILTGTPESQHNEYNEYKYFKRNVLKTSVSEVNKLTDIDVELIEYREGRYVADIQFRVNKKKQTTLALEEGPTIDNNLFNKMMSFGISSDEARQYYIDNDEGMLRATVDIVEKRIRKEGVAPVHSPAALFRDAIKKKYASPLQIAQKSRKPKTAANPDEGIADLRIKYDEFHRGEAKKMFAEYSDAEKQQALDRFRVEIHSAESPFSKDPTLVKSFETKGLSNKRAEVAFFTWLANITWGGEPTEAELFRLALTHGWLKTAL